MWLQKNKEELKKLKTWDETPIHVIPNVMVIQVLQCKLSPSSYIVGKWVVMTCVTSARYSRHTHTKSRDRGFLEGLLCIVPKRHFRITPYEEQYGDILYVFAIQDKMIFSMSQGSKDRLRQRHSHIHSHSWFTAFVKNIWNFSLLIIYHDQRKGMYGNWLTTLKWPMKFCLKSILPRTISTLFMFRK